MTSSGKPDVGVAKPKPHPLTTFHGSDSLPVLAVSQSKTLSQSSEAILRTVAKNSNAKAPSGYCVGSGVRDGGVGVRGDCVRGEDGDRVLPTPKELLEIRQRKKVVLQ